MVDIEKTLSELAIAMQGHREALAARGGDGASRKQRPATVDGRMTLVARLLVKIEADAGLRVDEGLEGKLRTVLASVGASDLDAWMREIEGFDREHPAWLALIESLTTHETYLFRDWEQLELLCTIGLAPLIAAARRVARPTLRLWSAGCASGEEAYTLAVLALEALVRAGVACERPQSVELVAPWTLDVVGTDISRLALAQAHNGLYSTGSLSSFRAAPEPLLRFFPLADALPGRTSRRVRRDVAQHVRFSRANLMRAQPPADDLDVVACRNVLVYFTPAARKIVRTAIEAAVRPGGFLLLGPTDAPPDPKRFETVWGTHAVIYRKRA
jgi:chemotaxis protein methyltransferase CheR